MVKTNARQHSIETKLGNKRKVKPQICTDATCTC